MSQPNPPPAGEPTGAPPPAPRSVRVRLARVALEAALGISGVAEGHAGRVGIAFTNDAGERLWGVIATAAPDGSVSVELHLVAELVPLVELGDAVRAAVVAAASATGLAESLARVDVRFEEVTAPSAAPAEAVV